MRHVSAVTVALAVLVATGAPLAAQQSRPAVEIARSEILPIVSEHVPEGKYRLLVALPADYASSTQSYAVLYLLDAHRQFPILVETYRYLASFDGIPPLIIVGIAHDGETTRQRARDFTPTTLSREVIAAKYGKWTADVTPESGAAPRFLRFLVDEVIPLVERTYRVNPGDRALFGTSYGGLFTAYALFQEPTRFQRLLIGSPALFWDDYRVLADEERLAARQDTLNVRVVAVLGGLETPLMRESWQRLGDRLRSRSYHGLEFTALLLPDETHTSVIPTMLSRALRILYTGQAAHAGTPGG